MSLGPEERKKLREFRMKQVLPDGMAPKRLTPVHQKRQYPKIHLRKAGNDAPRDPNAKAVLRETYKVVEPGSAIEKALRDSQKLQTPVPDDFLDYVTSALQDLESRGLVLFFFTLKGVSAYPFVHCASLTHYGENTDEFYARLDEYIAAHADMYYEPDSYRPITDSDELARIFESFAEHDRLKFRNVMGGIVMKAPHYRQIDFVGHDRSR